MREFVALFYLDIVVKNQVVITVSLQQRECAVDSKVLKLQHGLRVSLRNRRDKLVHDLEILAALEAGHAEAHIEGVIAEAFVVGADVDSDWQDTGGVEAARGDVKVEFSDGDT
jgi:hypothetical protein